VDVLALALVIVALILAVIEQISARGRSLACWAVIALAVAILLASLSTAHL
jgi:hypothetical protein